METNQTPSVQPEGGAVAQTLDASALVERFLSEADIARSTKETYRRALRQFFRWHESQNMQDLKRADIVAYKQAQLSKMKSNTVGAYLSALKSFFKWLEAERIYPNVAAGVKGTKVARGHRKDALTPSQVGYILESMEGESLRQKRDYAIFNLLVRTGLRTIELERANIEDIRNKGAQTVLYVQGKGREQKDDFVVLTDSAARPIYAYLSMRRERDRGGAALRVAVEQDHGAAAEDPLAQGDRQAGDARGWLRRRPPDDAQPVAHGGHAGAPGRGESPVGAVDGAPHERQHDARVLPQPGPRLPSGRVRGR